MSQDLALAKSRAHAFLNEVCCAALIAAKEKRSAADALNEKVRLAACSEAYRVLEKKIDTSARDSANLSALIIFEQACAPPRKAYDAAISVARSERDQAWAAANEQLKVRRQDIFAARDKAKFLAEEETAVALEEASEGEKDVVRDAGFATRRAIDESADADCTAAENDCADTCKQASEKFDRSKEVALNLYKQATMQYASDYDLACKPAQEAYLEQSKDAAPEFEVKIREADAACADEAFRIHAEYQSERRKRIKLLQTERAKLEAYFEWLSVQPGQVKV